MQRQVGLDSVVSNRSWQRPAKGVRDAPVDIDVAGIGGHGVSIVQEHSANRGDRGIAGRRVQQVRDLRACQRHRRQHRRGRVKIGAPGGRADPKVLDQLGLMPGAQHLNHRCRTAIVGDDEADQTTLVRGQHRSRPRRSPPQQRGSQGHRGSPDEAPRPAAPRRDAPVWRPDRRPSRCSCR